MRWVGSNKVAGVDKPTPSPFLKAGGKNAKGRHGENLQDIGKRIDVNAFAMETYWQDGACCFASDELYFVCAVS